MTFLLGYSFGFAGGLICGAILILWLQYMKYIPVPREEA